MSTVEHVGSTQTFSLPASLARGTYTAAVFSSAFLMFSIQPLFTKLVLPQLGGSPAVWSVAMVFFQGLLLLGYLYAHLSSRYLPMRIGLVVHAVLLLLTFASLPIAMSAKLGNPPVTGQVTWLLGVFALSVGLPFFAIAGNGPLLQAWFSRTAHKNAANPYFLYAASNLGSFAALLLYPALFETTLKLSAQSWAWSFGFAAMTVLIGACGYIALKGSPIVLGSANAAENIPAPGRTEIIGYVWLAFIPSALLVAVTAYISTDVAAAPFLWIIPLALFLLTFVLIFRDKPLVSPALVTKSLPIMAGMVILTNILEPNMLVTMIVHLSLFFAAALFCHQRLYDSRPATQHLTHFYLWMSFGGVLGGIFSALVAPNIFDRVLEYPLLICVVMLSHPALQKPRDGVLLKQAFPVILLGTLAVIGLQLFSNEENVHNGFIPVMILILGSLATIALYRQPIIQAALIPCLFLFSETTFSSLTPAHFERSFFGVHQTSLRENNQFRVLTHGVTIHGAQRVANADGTPFVAAPKPLTYYHPDGILAASLRLTPPKPTGRKLGVVGLGSGAHACNGQATDTWHFFEIDPVVEKIARDPKSFTFLSSCAPTARITIGDARLTLANEPAGQLDYLLIDAFSSDAIPVHLLTREAIALYMSRLTENGILTLHISNQHMELVSVVAALAGDSGYAVKVNTIAKSGNTLELPTSTVAAVLARKPELLSQFEAGMGWVTPSSGSTAVWTDDYSNIPGAIWRRYWRS